MPKKIRFRVEPVVFATLCRLRVPLSTFEIIQYAEFPLAVPSVRQALTRLVAQGRVSRVRSGQYAVTAQGYIHDSRNLAERVFSIVMRVKAPATITPREILRRYEDEFKEPLSGATATYALQRCRHLSHGRVVKVRQGHYRCAD